MPDPSRRTTTTSWRAVGAGIGAGMVGLAALVAFAVGLPRLHDDTAGVAPTLPARLAGGWTRLEDAASPPADPQAAFDQQQRQALDYVNRVLGRVYDEPTQFETYVAPGGQSLVLATLFDAAGGAFAPDGLVDPRGYGWARAPVELTRHGDAVCIASYLTPADTGAGEASVVPLSVSCQAPVDGATAQLGSTAMSVGDTVALLDDLVARVGQDQ